MIGRARAVGVTGFVVAGVDPAGWVRQRALARTPGVRWTAGLHPWTVARASTGEVEAALSGLPDCFDGARPACGVGETGLDARFVPKETLELQASAFAQQLALSRERALPVVLHVVSAHGAALEVLRRFAPLTGLVHAFGGSAEVAAAYLDVGLCISVSGGAARAGRKLRRALAEIPADRLLVETDAPDQPLERGARNEPAALLRVAAAVAEVRNESADAILRRSTALATALFGGF